MKYAILLGLVGTVALVAGCEPDPIDNTTSSSSSSSSSTSGSSSASGSSSSGAGGEGTGGMGTGGMGTGGMGTGGMGTGGAPPVCDNGEVVDKDDAAMRCQQGVPTEVTTIVMAPASMVWASNVVAFSTEYGPGNYGSGKATGAPDVYPSSGDEANAWAQSMEDATGEFIKVGYANPVVAESVWIYETFNPGAISKVTITAADGDHVVYDNANAQPLGICSHILSVSTKTCSPISAVRVDLLSDKVLGYNEIDAIGLLPPK